MVTAFVESSPSHYQLPQHAIIIYSGGTFYQWSSGRSKNSENPTPKPSRTCLTPDQQGGRGKQARHVQGLDGVDPVQGLSDLEKLLLIVQLSF